MIPFIDAIAASPIYSKLAGWTAIVIACIAIIWIGAAHINHRVETWKAGVVEAAHRLPKLTK